LHRAVGVARPGAGHRLRGTWMDEERRIEMPADDRTKMAARKSWHAPKFFVTEVLETSGGCTGGGADSPMTSS